MIRTLIHYVLYPLFGAGVVGFYAYNAYASYTRPAVSAVTGNAIEKRFLEKSAYMDAPLTWSPGIFNGPASTKPVPRPESVSGGDSSYSSGSGSSYSSGSGFSSGSFSSGFGK